MRPVIQTIVTGSGVLTGNDPVVLDMYQNPMNVSVKATSIGNNSGTIQVSYDDPFAAYAASYSGSAVWTSSGTVNPGATTILYYTGAPIRALRYAPGGVTNSGSLTLTVTQAGQMA